MSALSAASLYSLISLPASCAEVAAPSDAIALDSPQEMLSLLQLQRHCHLMHLFICRFPQLLSDIRSSTAAVEELATSSPDTANLLGITALRCFTQHNFTGPPLSSDLESDLQGFDNVLDMGDGVREHLRDGGEEMYYMAPYCSLLLIARNALQHTAVTAACLPASAWWRLRLYHTHNSCLSGPSPNFLEKIMESSEIAAADILSNSLENSAQLRARLLLETSVAAGPFKQRWRVKKLLSEAQALLGLQLNITGIMGTRTKFQSEAKAQLVLQVTEDAASSASGCDSPQAPCLPSVVALEEDVELMERVKLEDNSGRAPLSDIASAIILCWTAHYVSDAEKGELTDEELATYIERVKLHPGNWLVFSTCLLLQTRVESRKSKTAGRSVFQLEVLISEYATAPAGERERMMWLHALPWPVRWELRAEMAQRYMGVGMLRSATDLFAQLELWEEAVTCLKVTDDVEKARAMAEERIAVRPESGLLCLLAEMSQDPVYAQRAWDLSGGKYARAQRTLARMAFNRGDKDACITHFQMSLALNPLFEDAWFTMGCCLMQKEMLKEAAEAFSRAVQLNQESFEAWANLGGIHMRMRQWPQAFCALDEAIKLSRSNWRLWQNYLYTALSSDHVTAAIDAAENLLELQGKDGVDVEVYEVLFKKLPIAAANMTSGGSSSLISRGIALLSRASGLCSDNVQLWTLYAGFMEKHGRADAAAMLDIRLNAYRNCQKQGWTSNAQAFPVVVEHLHLLVNAYLLEGSPKSMFAAAAAVQTVMIKSRDCFESSESYSSLPQLLQRIKDVEAQLKAPSDGRMQTVD